MNDDQEGTKDTPKDAGSGQSASISSSASGLEGFAAASKESRDAAKWLIGGFGAIGAALAAGTQLSSIGALDDPGRLALAIVAAAVGLMATATAAAITMWVLLPGYTTLSAIARQEREGKHWADLAYFGDVVTESPDVAEGYATAVAGPKGLLQSLQTALDDRAEKYKAYLEAYEAASAETDAKELVFNAADARAAELGRVAHGVANAASYRRLNRGSRPWVVAVVGLALVIGVSLGLFAWAANPKKADQSTAGGATVSRRGAVITGIDLSGRDLTGVDLEGATLTDVVLRGAQLDDAHLKHVTWNNVTCPDGSVTPAGGTCLGHLK
jgi:hypothetical protein